MPRFNDIDLENWKESDIWTDSLWIINERDKSGKHSNFYHGNFVPQIPHQLILRFSKEDDLIFAVIGEGEERKNLESLIKKYSLENNFHLLGSKTDAHQYLKAFDLYVMPSVKEGLPYAILEAQAAGLKVIATKVGGLPEIVKKESLVEAKNPQALAEKIKEALLKPDSLNNYDHLSWNDFLNITTGLYN